MLDTTRHSIPWLCLVITCTRSLPSLAKSIPLPSGTFVHWMWWKWRIIKDTKWLPMWVLATTRSTNSIQCHRWFDCDQWQEPGIHGLRECSMGGPEWLEWHIKHLEAGRLSDPYYRRLRSIRGYRWIRVRRRRSCSFPILGWKFLTISKSHLFHIGLKEFYHLYININGFLWRRIYYQSWDWTKDQDWESYIWKRLAAKYYMIDGKFTDQPIPDSRAYLSNKVFGVTIQEKAKKRKHATRCSRISDPKGERKYLMVGSKAWNERFLEYE